MSATLDSSVPSAVVALLTTSGTLLNSLFDAASNVFISARADSGMSGGQTVGNIIYISQNWINTLSPEAIALIIGHELAHQVLQAGPANNYVGYANAPNPFQSVLIGETNEAAAYTAEYIIAEQLQGISVPGEVSESLLQTGFGTAPALLSKLNADEKEYVQQTGENVKSIISVADLLASCRTTGSGISASFV